ncbi:MAG: hypothetical protein IT338_10110 [Thermomicrobiales bacterium]|nr:hypothetical protein [Thermomicrobiales bacterium]
MRRLLVALGMLLALGLVPSSILAQEATPAAGAVAPALDRTNTRYISPFTPDGLNPGLVASVKEEQGICADPSSAAIGRPDAWDCLGESDQVYDPCFENPFVGEGKPEQVACFDTPFSTDIVVLTLTEPLSREKAQTTEAAAEAARRGEENVDLAPWDLPWALELANGERCTLLRGTLTLVAGQVVNYGCANGGSVVGMTDRSEPRWVVSYLANGDYATTLVDVTTAWS